MDRLSQGVSIYPDFSPWRAHTHIHIPIYGTCTQMHVQTCAQLLNKEGVEECMDRIGQGIAIRDGIIVVAKSAVVPDGTEI